METDFKDTIKLIKYESGFTDTPKKDNLGRPVVGYGLILGQRGGHLSHYQFKLSKKAALIQLGVDVAAIHDSLLKGYPFYAQLNSPPRQSILISLSYGLGKSGGGMLQLKDMLAAMRLKEYREAGRYLLNSIYAAQEPKRAHRHANVLITGDWVIYDDII